VTSNLKNRSGQRISTRFERLAKPETEWLGGAHSCRRNAKGNRCNNSLIFLWKLRCSPLTNKGAGLHRVEGNARMLKSLETKPEIELQVTSCAGAVRAVEERRRQHAAKPVRVHVVEKVCDLRGELDIVARAFLSAVAASSAPAASSSTATTAATTTPAAKTACGPASTSRAATPTGLLILTIGVGLILTIGLTHVRRRSPARIVLRKSVV
jgi:hypothetical protein